MPARVRLDHELVSQGLFASVDEAARSVMAGEVSTSDRRLEKPGELVRPGIELHVRGRARYVSRGGLKLERALDAFGIAVAGRDCLDVGCSTGGFTDCLLRRGARSVLSVDVGQAQFDWGLRHDPRVTLRERTNARDLPDEANRASVEVAVCDVSFTSVAAVLPAMLWLLAPQGDAVTLVKPQFEAARDEVGEGGVVREAAVRLAALRRVAALFAEAGLGPLGACESPVAGHKGNVEYLLWGRAGSPACELPLARVVEGHEVALA